MLSRVTGSDRKADSIFLSLCPLCTLENRRLIRWLQEERAVLEGRAMSHESKRWQPCAELPGAAGKGWPLPVGDELTGLG